MTDTSAARARLRAMALSLATGTGETVEPRAFDQALDAYRDALLTPTAEVWTVWPEDEPILGHYTDEVTAKLAAIEFQQAAEGPGHGFVYAWNEHGGHLELCANGDDTGFRVKRETVHGKTAPTVTDDELARLRAVDAAYATLVHRAHDTNDDHLIDAIARANRETAVPPPAPDAAHRINAEAVQR
jgi:hypothetical protein